MGLSVCFKTVGARSVARPQKTRVFQHSPLPCCGAVCRHAGHSVAERCLGRWQSEKRESELLPAWRSTTAGLFVNRD